MNETLLIVADSERDANMLYAVGMFVPDPFIYLNCGGRPLIVMSDLEIDRARAQAPHCRVLSLSAYQRKLRAAGAKKASLAHVIRQILREKKIRRALVPDNFPLGLARDLKKLGIKLKPRAGIFSRNAKSNPPTKSKKSPPRWPWPRSAWPKAWKSCAGPKSAATGN